MTAALARTTGANKAIRAHLTVLLILQLYGFLFEAGGSIILYFAFYWDLRAMVFYGLFLAAGYYLGKYAGKEIFDRPGRYLLSGIKYAVYACAIPLLCNFAAEAALKDAPEEVEFVHLQTKVIMVLMLPAWLWAARSIKLETEQEEKSE